MKCPGCGVSFDHHKKFCTPKCQKAHHNRNYRKNTKQRKRTGEPVKRCWCGSKKPTTRHMLKVGPFAKYVPYYLCKKCAKNEQVCNERRPLLDMPKES